jgi:isopenicillin N synthase-like dioxygenase
VGSFKDRNKDDKMSMWFGGLPGSLQKDIEALPPFWHAKIQKIEVFKRECHALVLKLLVCFAIAMDLPDIDFFAKAHRENTGKGNSLRTLMYPARGSKPHNVGSRMG